MILMKHKTLGNKYFEDGKEDELRAQGWVKWPRSAEEKSGLHIPVFVKPKPACPSAVEIADEIMARVSQAQPAPAEAQKAKPAKKPKAK